MERGGGAGDDRELRPGQVWVYENKFISVKIKFIY